MDRLTLTLQKLGLNLEEIQSIKESLLPVLSTFIEYKILASVTPEILNNAVVRVDLQTLTREEKLSLFSGEVNDINGINIKDEIQSFLDMVINTLEEVYFNLRNIVVTSHNEVSAYNEIMRYLMQLENEPNI